MVKFNYVVVDAESKHELYCFHRDRELDSNEQHELVVLFAEIFPQYAAKAVELVEFADPIYHEEDL